VSAISGSFIKFERYSNAFIMERSHFKTLRWLTYLLSVTLGVVSIAGAFLPGTYSRDSVSLAAQAAGQDLVDLFLVLPLLLLSFRSVTRGNRRGTLIYGGVLAYLVYSFVIYAFGVYFNRFFLFYCATLGLSLYAFILYMGAMRKAGLENWFRKVPAKPIAGYLMIVALVFYVLWFRSILPAIISNVVPAEVADNHLLVNPVHVIDLAFALPALLIGAFLVWRQKAMGYLIASLALVFMVLLTVALVMMVVMLVVRGINEDDTVALVFGILSVVSVWMLLLLLRKLEPVN
jgi:hypothetical protein